MLKFLLKKNFSIFQKIKTEIQYRKDISKFFREINNLYKKNNTFSFKDKIIIECYWDNPGYWFSLSLIMNALSIEKDNCIAVVSKSRNKSNIIRRLKLFGIKKIILLEDYFYVNDKFFNIRKIRNEKDLLKTKLPIGFSTDLLYDEFCKFQNSPFVQINHSKFEEHFQIFLNVILSSEKIFNELKPKYLISSHNTAVYYGSLVNAAIRNNSKVITLSLENNSLKFLQCVEKKLQHNFESGPTLKDFNNLEPQKKILLRKLGSQYIKNRFNGKVNDAGAMFAYNERKRLKINKRQIKKICNWNKQYPIITIFSHAYMDYQRSWGWNNFMNFLDLNLSTISYLLEKKNIYIIFKQHPANQMYKKIKEASNEYFLNKFKSPNFLIADIEWNNKELIKLSDGIITGSGTVGIEASHLKTPVLCANRGWYGHTNFTNYAKSRKDFFKLIDKKFWESSKLCIKNNKEKSDEFSGWFYTNPVHSKSYKIPDTINGFKNFKILKEWVRNNYDELDLEINCLKKWLISRDFSYHTWKIKNIYWNKH